LGSAGGPHFVQVQNKHSFLPYGLPPNYTPPNVAPAPDENVNNSPPILIDSLRANNPNLIMHMSLNPWGTHEVPRDDNLADFEPYLGYAT